MFKKALVFTLLVFCLMAASSALAQTVHLKDVGISVDIPEGCAAFYSGHVDNAQALKYMGMDKKKMTAYLKECGYQIVICQNNPSCEIMIETRPAEYAKDWNLMDIETFFEYSAEAAEKAKGQLNIKKMLPLITNQTRYMFTHFATETSSKHTYDMYDYYTQVAGKIFIITCLSHDDTIDEEKAFFDQVLDSIWYDGVDTIYGPAPTASGSSKGKVMTTDILSIKFPNTWSAKQSSGLAFRNGYIHLNISSIDGWADLPAEKKEGRDRSKITFDGLVSKNDFGPISDWVKGMASNLETALSSTPMNMENWFGTEDVKAYGLPDSMLTMAIDSSVNYDDGQVAMLGNKPFILFTGKSTITGEDEKVMVRFTQDTRLYYNIYNGYTNMLRFEGILREGADQEIKKVLDTVKFK